MRTRSLLRTAAFVVVGVVVLAACQVTTPNPPVPAARTRTDHPTVMWWGDSFSLDAEPQTKADLATSGYQLPFFHALLGDSMCLDQPNLANAIAFAKPQDVVLQYTGNGSLWRCVEGYDATYQLYDQALYRIGLTAAFNAAPGGSRVFLVGPIPDAFGNDLLPGNSPAVTDVFKKYAAQYPGTFTYVDASAGLTPGAGARQECYPSEPSCGTDGKVQVREDFTNPYTGVTTPGGGSHFCTKMEIPDLATMHCLVYDAGAVRYAYSIIGAMVKAGA